MTYPERPYFGDPDAMDGLATRLALAADQISSGARGVSARAESIDFMGPAATRFRASVETQRGRADGAADRTLALSHLLRRAAETARFQIAEWERQALLAAQDDGGPTR